MHSVKINSETIEEQIGDAMWAQFFHSLPWYTGAKQFSIIARHPWLVVRDTVHAEIMPDHNNSRL